MRYLIVGNGVAGTTAALHIRKGDPSGEITIITDEDKPFYSRIRLMDYLAGEASEDDIVMRKPEWYEENRIKLLLNVKAASMDAGGRDVRAHSGEKFPYERLLLATGGSSYVPPIPGAKLKGVFTLRTLDDARAIRECARGARDVLLIGGGVLGLEAGNALRKTGLRVSVVEFFPRLLPRQVDAEGSRILCARMEEMGFAFHLGARTKELVGEGGVVRGAVLEDGTSISADMVVVSAGVRANAALAEAAGIKCGRSGIAVDDRMRTSAPDVYAAGDAAEHRGVSYGIWPAAEAEGRVAGTNMAGGEAVFEGMTPVNVLKVAGVELASAGDIDAEGACPCIIKKDEERRLYLKLVHKDGSLRGCIILGTRKRRGEILRAVSEGRSPDSVKEILEEV